MQTELKLVKADSGEYFFEKEIKRQERQDAHTRHVLRECAKTQERCDEQNDQLRQCID